MLNPTDILVENLDHIPPWLRAQAKALGNRFDDAILIASATGNWPAFVSAARDGMAPKTVEYVAEIYRSNGWIVDTTQDLATATIDHPQRVKPAGK